MFREGGGYWKSWGGSRGGLEIWKNYAPNLGTSFCYNYLEGNRNKRGQSLEKVGKKRGEETNRGP